MIWGIVSSCDECITEPDHNEPHLLAAFASADLYKRVAVSGWQGLDDPGHHLFGGLCHDAARKLSG